MKVQPIGTARVTGRGRKRVTNPKTDRAIAALRTRSVEVVLDHITVVGHDCTAKARHGYRIRTAARAMGKTVSISWTTSERTNRSHPVITRR